MTASSSSPPSPSPGFAGRTWILPAALLALLLGTMAIRRLNFDEALLVRSGWLALSGIPAGPPFLMPATVLAGLAAKGLPDPGLLFPVLRLTTGIAIAAALLAAAGRLSVGVEGALAATLTLSSAAFFAHGLELRYDSAILLGSLVALPLLEARGRLLPFALGAVTAAIALHHVKGLYVAATILLAALVGWRDGPDLRRRIPLASAGFLAVAAAWLLGCRAAGRPDEPLSLFRFFSTLASETARAPFWETLAPALLRDAAWWAAVATGVAATWWRPAAPPPSLVRSATILGLGGVGFLALHPHPFPYMLALPTPFLAVASAPGWLRLVRKWGGRPLVPIGALLALQILLGSIPGRSQVEGLRSTMAGEVEALRFVRAHSRPGDRVLDPSGLVYFLPPLHPEWYVDTLFVDRVARGRWMAGLRPEGEGIWALATYRLDWLPPEARHLLRHDFVAIGGPLLLPRRDRRVSGDAPLRFDTPPERVESFW